ncbi:hypothetical protein NX059_006553 [Plenodomus lindquistii]|nr:hypothetical protein NX059_006553 [Plenodomus lindquistii]
MEIESTHLELEVEFDDAEMDYDDSKQEVDFDDAEMGEYDDSEFEVKFDHPVSEDYLSDHEQDIMDITGGGVGTSAPVLFKHAPLDLTRQSVRLIRIYPTPNRTDPINCEIRHAEISEEYTCLSYVWGSANQGEWIIVNGQRFWVRTNLYHFLVYARRIPDVLNKWLWIDAISIDQTASDERNHQVQQMGEIYTNARKVIAWFGIEGSVASFLRHCSRGKLAPTGILDFHYHEYWDRAWITQEIVLARSLTFMAQNISRNEFHLFCQPQNASDTMIMAHDPRQLRKMQGRSLIYLLHQNQRKECAERRDVVFSVLALCGDGSGLKVDYNSANTAFAKAILVSCRRSFCLCSVFQVSSNFAMDSIHHDDTSKISFAKMEVFTPARTSQKSAPITWYEAEERARSDGLVWWSHYKDVADHKWRCLSLTMDLRRLCQSYSAFNYLITLYVNSANEVFDFKLWKSFPVFKAGIFEADVENDVCVVYISLKKLFDISCTHRANSGCCDYVSSIGTYRPNPRNFEPILHLL